MEFVVDELFAFIAIDEDGDEGVIAVTLPGSDTVMPLVAADLTRVNEMVPFAEAIQEQTGHTYKLKHFTLLGEVSEEYLAQYKDVPEPASGDADGPPGDDELRADNPRKGNGSGKDVA